MSDNNDLVAVWEVPLSDKVYTVEFEHGTTTGRRQIRVDGKVIYSTDWMFKLVGSETFTLGKKKEKCTIYINAINGFEYEYMMEVNGKNLKKFIDNRSKIQKTWLIFEGSASEQTRIVLEKDTMDVWANGKKLDAFGEFTDDGTETHFELGNHACYIKAITTGKRKDGIVHKLVVDGKEIMD